MVDILSRLPVKTLIRSTSVSKAWYSLITNPNFISTHIKRSISQADTNNDHFPFIIPESISPQNPCSIISEETFVVYQKIEIPFSTKSRTLKLIGSVNGLLCVSDDIPFRGRDLYLWNPSVRKYRALFSYCFSKLSSVWSTYPIIGFGFHGPTDDYRIVRIMYRSDDECNSFGKLAPKVEGFSLRRNTWKKIGNAAVPRLASQEDWAFVDGNVYWLEAKRPGDYPESMWILSFDFNDEVFGEVECPAKFRDWVGREANVTLMEFKGSVSLCVFGLNQEHGVSQRCCVWVMRHEGGAVSWTKQFKVELKERFGWPLTFTKSGKLIIASADSDFMLKDLVSCLQFKDLGNDAPSDVDVAFIESLVLLGGGTVLSRHTK